MKERELTKQEIANHLASLKDWKMVRMEKKEKEIKQKFKKESK